MARSFSRSKRILAVALGLVAVAALSSAAQAFTFDNQTTAGSSSGSSNYTNPARSRMLTNNGDGQTTIRNGNTSLQFGTPPSLTDQRYYPEQLFQPNRPNN